MWIYKKTFPDLPCVSQMLGGPSLRRGDTNENLNIPSKIGCVGEDICQLVTWEFPLRTDSASWKSLYSFMKHMSFLPDNFMTMFWSSELSSRDRVESAHTDFIGSAVQTNGIGDKNEFQQCIDASRTRNCCLFPGHSGRNPIDFSLEDNVIIQGNVFPYIYHVGMYFYFALYHQFGIHIWKSQFEQKTDKHKDFDVIELSVLCHAQYLHKTKKRDQDAIHCVLINFVSTKRLKFFQTRSNAIISRNTSSFRIPHVVSIEIGEVNFEKVYVSLRLPPNIFVKFKWKRTSNSDHAQRAEVWAF